MDPTLLLVAAVLIGTGIGLGWFIAQRSVAFVQKELTEARESLQLHQADCESWRGKYTSASQELAAERKTSERVAGLEQEVRAERLHSSGLAAKVAAFEKGEEERQRSHEVQIAQLKDLEQKLETQFGLVAAKALDHAQGKFLERANHRFGEAEKETSAKLQLLLQPVENSLKQHKELIDKVESARTESYGTLTGIMDAMKVGQEAVRNEAAKLVMSLRGNPKTPGRWGEKHFQNLIELAGLSNFVDYEKEKHIETQSGKIRPDYVIRLPGGQSLVVDVKCSVDHYISAAESTIEAERLGFLESHARSVTVHADALAKKSYTEHLDTAPEYVIMYVPGDNFFSAALEADPNLWDRSAKKGVIISCPSTFLPLAHSLSNMWRSHELQRDAAEVAKIGKDLYAKMCAMTDNLRLVGKGLMSAMDNYNGFVGSMEGSVLPQARKFKDLNIDTSNREIPELPPIDRIAREPTQGRDLIFHPTDQGSQSSGDTAEAAE